MATNEDIIDAAKEILDILEYLVVDDATDLRAQLETALTNVASAAEGTAARHEETKTIAALLASHDATKQWMMSRLSAEVVMDSPSRSGAAKNLVHEEDKAHTYPVWFGTNREPVNRDDISQGFSGDRCKNSGEVFYGSCHVKIPKTHRFGEVGRSWWRRWAMLDFRGDDSLKVKGIYPAPDAAGFWKGIRSVFEKNEVSEREALVFIHGYNNSFEAAAIRAAQIGFDLKVKGQTAFFSWPSSGKTTAYPSDESSIQVSESAITQFLIDFSKHSGAERIHIMAHSMGNRGLLRALKNITHDIQLNNSEIKFGHIILAAPDLDVGLFRQAKAAYTSLSESTTIYSSATDLPVSLSRWLHGYPRLGLVPPVTVEEGVNTIKVQNFNIFNLGHGYFAEASALLNDIFDLLHNNTPPAQRQMPQSQQTEQGEAYWLIDTR